MSIEKLKALIPPPSSPVEVENGHNWAAVQKSIGVELPSDYLEFAVTYGSGRFCQFIEVANPLSENYSDYIEFECTILRELKDSGEGFPYDVFPKSPGLLPWGRDENGHTMCWLTKGKPEKWPIILRRHEGNIEKFNLSLTLFLTKALSNTLKCSLWQTPFSPADLIFEPVTPKSKGGSKGKQK